MRILRSLALGSLMLLAPSAHADKRARKTTAQTKVAVVDDEPMSHEVARPQSVDEIRTESLSTRGTGDVQPLAINRQTPTPSATGIHTSLPDAVVHPVAAPPTDSGPAPSLTDDAIVELAAHQMRHQRSSLDACTQAAQVRNPNESGSLTLRFRVENRKVVNVSVDNDSVNDARLSSCLVEAGRALNFSLKQASFFWPVSLSSTTTPSAPTASR